MTTHPHSDSHPKAEHVPPVEVRADPVRAENLQATHPPATDLQDNQPAEAASAASAWRARNASAIDLPANAGLLLIDFQDAIDDPVWGRRNNPGAESAARHLLAKWRLSGRPVIHVQHLSTDPASPYRPGQPGVEFKAGLSPFRGELVVQKATTSAFVDTGLESLLRQQGISTLVVAGVITNNSVEATARHAGNLGYRVIVVADALRHGRQAGPRRPALDGRGGPRPLPGQPPG